MGRKLLPSADDLYTTELWIFEDDGAKCHRSGIVKNLVESKSIDTFECPGDSPDFRPIENLLTIFRKSFQKYRPTSKTTPIEAIVKLWHHEISQRLCENFVRSVARRIQKCILAKGGHTKD